MNYWKTEKGKETLCHVFATLVEIEEDRWQQVDTTKIRFAEIVYQLRLTTGWYYNWVYTDTEVAGALTELCRLGFVRKTKDDAFFITKTGWEFWWKRRKMNKQGARA